MKIKYLGIEYDSKEEIQFQQWIMEALAAGFIYYAEYKPATWVLSESQKSGKTHLCRKITYNPDWLIKFSTENGKIIMDKLFDHGLYIQKKVVNYEKKRKSLIDGTYEYLGGEIECYAYIDIKGLGNKGKQGMNSSAYTFPIKQAWVYQKYGIYINKVVAKNMLVKGRVTKKGFFQRTFVPLECAYMKNRKVLTRTKPFINCKLLSEVRNVE